MQTCHSLSTTAKLKSHFVFSLSITISYFTNNLIDFGQYKFTTFISTVTELQEKNTKLLY